METLRVELGERSYDIVIGAGLFEGLGARLRSLNPGPRVAVVSNPTVFELYGDAVMHSIEDAGFEANEILIPDGEEFKDLLWLEVIYAEMLRERLDRKSVIVALGGGVIGDMTGFAAATYMRGIAFVQVPTTLLAQVDSSVGGKTGVNHALGKNMIGAFWQPSLVLADTAALKSLPRRQYIAGLAEVIKYGVIKDAEFFSWLIESREELLKLDQRAVSYAVLRSCEIKAGIVASDEREAGLRAILNFGHTVGHAIETATGYTRYLHGEAISIGMSAAARLAYRLGMLTEPEAALVRDLIGSYGLPTALPHDVRPDALLDAMSHDKKTEAGVLRFVLPEHIGEVKFGVAVKPADVRAVLVN